MISLRISSFSSIISKMPDAARVAGSETMLAPGAAKDCDRLAIGRQYAFRPAALQCVQITRTRRCASTATSDDVIR